jgi:hypothetical protein
MSNEDIKKEDGVELPRKRGRPRKNQNSPNEKKIISKDKLRNKIKIEDEEIIIHLPMNMKTLKKLQNSELNIITDTDEKNHNKKKNNDDLNSINENENENENDEFELENDNDNENENENLFTENKDSNSQNNTKKDVSLTISDMADSGDSDSDSIEIKRNKKHSKPDQTLISDIKEKDKIIRKLKDELLEFKNAISEMTSGSKEPKLIPMNIQFISNHDNKPIVAEHTNIACWWCTYNFDTAPCFIPENYYDNKYYVFGCFCSYNCAAAYNLSLNDYKFGERYSLLKQLYNSICGNNGDNDNNDIEPSPPRESLEKFGGPATINEFRKNIKICEKEYRLIMPPMVSVIPYIEESYKEKNSSNPLNKFSMDEPKLKIKRSKPLPNSSNTLIEKMNIQYKKKH